MSLYSPPSAALPGSRPSHRGSRLPADFVQEVLARVDITGVIARSVELKKAGANLLGLCPFHGEKSPSFTVSPTKQFYHCFGCGAHGSAISFLMDHDGMPFRDAVRTLAESVSMRMPEAVADNTPLVDPRTRAGIFEAMEIASRYFAQQLKASPAARDYLRTARQLDPSMARRFIIGYAPAGWRNLAEVFPQYASDATLVAAGLVRQKDKTDGPQEHPGAQGADSGQPAAGTSRTVRYDWFRDRIMFGVRDMRGRIVAWGGRTLSGADPKYLNSPDSPVFDKSEVLFGAYEARDDIRRLNEVLVVEGYMGVIMLAQHGVPNAVASMGTALTTAHLDKVMGMAARVIFCFDGDAAGRKAARRALHRVATVIQDSSDVRFMLLPQGMDPDDFVRAHGVQAFTALKTQAAGFSEFALQLCREEAGIDPAQPPHTVGMDARVRFAALANAVVREIPTSPTTRGLLRMMTRQINAEAQQVGGAARSLAAHRATRSDSADLWQRLMTAADVAPATAREQRQHISELLDAQSTQEMAVLHKFDALDGSAIDRVDHPQYMAMRDLLRAAATAIERERMQQVRLALQHMLDSGEIDETEYLQQMATLHVH